MVERKRQVRRLYQATKWLLMLSMVLIVVGCSAAQDSFELAKQANTVEGYDAFLKQYADSDFGFEAKGLREAAYFKRMMDKAVQNDSEDFDYRASFFDSYLDLYPAGKFAADATHLRQKNWFELASDLNTPETYKSYLREYPSGEYADEARRLREKCWFESGKNKKTQNAFDSYLVEYPRGVYADEARRLREKTWFGLAVKTNTVQGYRQFLLEYPTSAYSTQALENIEEIDFNLARSKNAIQAYDLFLMKYPKGKYTQAAKELREAFWRSKASEIVPAYRGAEYEAWQFTLRTDNYFQYEWFIKHFPNSSHIKEAKNRSLEKTRANNLLLGK